MKMIKDIRFWVCVIGIVILGFLSGLLSGNPGEYYYSLQLPPFAPPSWIFGPMWTLLYILMGISLYLLLNHNNKKQRNNLVGLFVIQFIFNFNSIVSVDVSFNWNCCFNGCRGAFK